MRGVVVSVISTIILLFIIIAMLGMAGSFTFSYYKSTISRVVRAIPSDMGTAYVQNIGTEIINLPPPSEAPFQQISGLVANSGFEQGGNGLAGWHVTYPVDVVMITDRSGSMVQSGWGLEAGPAAEEFNDVSVPGGGWSGVYGFNANNTERLAASIAWEEDPGYPGSGGSEFVVNLQRPDGSWVFTYPGNPDGPPESMNAGGTVDPGGSHGIGYGTEYYSGICTKPQALLAENSTGHPIDGTWHVAVYGWNLRPKNSPPGSMKVNISIFRDMAGPGDDIGRTETIIAIDAAMDAAKAFLNHLKDIDQASYVKFGSFGVLAQGLTPEGGNGFQPVREAIDNTGLEGGTAINTGIDKAVNEVTGSGRPGAFPALVLLTDGQNDNGRDAVLSSPGFREAVNKGIPVYTIGLTYFADDALLEQIASGTGGEYYFAPDAGTLHDIYEKIAREISWRRSAEHRVYGDYSIELVGGEGNRLASDYMPVNASYEYRLSQHIRREITGGAFSVQLELYDSSYGLLDTLILDNLMDSGGFELFSYDIGFEGWPDAKHAVLLYKWLAGSGGMIWMDDVFFGPVPTCTGSGRTYRCGDLEITKLYGDGDLYPYFDSASISPQGHASIKDANCQGYSRYRVSTLSNTITFDMEC